MGESCARLQAPFAEVLEELPVSTEASLLPKVPRDHLQPPVVWAEPQTAVFGDLVQLEIAAQRRHLEQCSQMLWMRKEILEYVRGALDCNKFAIPDSWLPSAAMVGVLCDGLGREGSSIRRISQKSIVKIQTASLPPHGELPSSSRSIA